MKVAKKITELIGRTPLLELGRISASEGLENPLIAKLERSNPGGSSKDRVALSMIEEAERLGRIKPGDTIVEPTSGNTGVGLAMVAAVKGYKLVLTMPETMSVERRNLLRVYGAEIVLTKGSEGMDGAVRAANELCESTPGAIILQQFTNEANPMAHYATTGAEIWEQTDRKIDVLVAGVGTGGTVSGTGKRLKELNPNVRVVAVEPKESPVLSGGMAGPHKIQGVGANFIPENYDAEVVDEVVAVASADAIEMTRKLAQKEGLLVGISSGAAVAAALSVGKRPDMQGKNIVVILPDTGERYLSVL